MMSESPTIILPDKDMIATQESCQRLKCRALRVTLKNGERRLYEATLSTGLVLRCCLGCTNWRYENQIAGPKYHDEGDPDCKFCDGTGCLTNQIANCWGPHLSDMRVVSFSKEDCHPCQCIEIRRLNSIIDKMASVK